MRLVSLLLSAFAGSFNIRNAMALEIQVSTVARLGDVAYYIHQLPTSDRKLNATGLGNEQAQSLQPCTVLSLEAEFPSRAYFQKTFAEFAVQDDVWSSTFAGTLVLLVTGSAQLPSQDKIDELRKLGVNHVYTMLSTADEPRLPHGPYFLQHGKLQQVYRLYPDTADAFIVSTVPDHEDGFRSLDAAAYGEQYPSALTVAVPSRLYHTPTKEKPFAGKRVAIKDIFDLKGLKTGASSRAFTELHFVKDQTATAVQRLIDLGVVIVGKTKTTQFADSEWPTCDWVDYHGPFNPRGDGYLTPSGSSAGSAAAVAAYRWLDFALGSDTLGSIRAPAAAQGIFGMRPTLGATCTEGMVPYSANWDTVGGFARTATDFKALAKALYGTRSQSGGDLKKPTSLLIPTDYWEIKDGPSAEIFEAFISRLEDFLKVKRTEISLAEKWRAARPEGMDVSLAKAFHNVFDWSANLDQWTGLLKPFTEEYEAQKGKPPALNPQVRFKVSYTPTVTAEQKRKGEELSGVFHDWFYKHIMPPAEDGYSSSIIVLPWTNGKPSYRDEYKLGPQEFTGQGFFFYNVGPYARCPELIFPVGNTSYTSKYTAREEQLPAALGLIAAEGSDVMLAELVAALFEGMEDTGGNIEVQAPFFWDDL